MIGSLPELDLVAVCADMDALLQAVEEHDPEVVLTDIRMPPTGTDEGIQVAEKLRVSHPGTGVVVLSHYVEPEYALALLRHGAAGRAYLLKERVGNVQQLLDAVKDVAAGGSVIDPKVVEALVAAKVASSDSPLAGLTRRENEVLQRLAQGKNNAAIGASLFLTEHAVEKHINAIFSKLHLAEERDAHRRVKAALLYLGNA